MSTEAITAFIIDDELPAINKLKMQLESVKNVRVIGTSTSSIDGLKQVKETNPNVVFLDITMPELDGFDLFPFLPKESGYVFVSASQDYAVDAFDTDAIDYLLKPVSLKRLVKCIEKIEKHIVDVRSDNSAGLSDETEQALRNSKLVSKQGDRMFLVSISDIRYFTSVPGSVMAYTDNKVYPIALSLDKLCTILPQDAFVRFHRSFIINVEHIKEVQRWFGGKLLVIMNDSDHTEITSSRDGARILKRQFHF